MNTKLVSFILAISSLLLSATIAQAHHGTSNFDMEHEVRLRGVVDRVEWANPHCYIYFHVTDEKGVATPWTIETGSPNMQVRRGLTRDSFKPGDKINIGGNVYKDGAKMIYLQNIYDDSGKLIWSERGHE